MVKQSVLGIFVGGSSNRMRSFPKGLLKCPGKREGTLVEHWRELAEQLELATVLVGAVSAYGHLGLTTIADNPTGIGPLGGMQPFLEYCHGQQSQGIAVACDMPYVTSDLLRRLCGVVSQRPIVAPRQPESLRWEPLFGQYDPETALPHLHISVAEHRHSLQSLLNVAQAEVFSMNSEDWPQLRDWDYPDDIESGNRSPLR